MCDNSHEQNHNIYNWAGTDKSFATTNPQYDNRLFIELQVQYMKIPTQTWGEHVHRNSYWHSEQFLYTTCSPHVLQKEELVSKIYLYVHAIIGTTYNQLINEIKKIEITMMENNIWC